MLLLIGLLFILLLGCGNMNQFTPEQVITNALEAENELTYYAEMEMTVDGLDELENIAVKEWRHNEKSRVEMETDGELILTVSDGQSFTMYEEKENKAFKMEDDDLSELNRNPREEVEMFLDMVRDTHDIETVGEEEIANRPAFHMVAKKRDDQKSLLGDQEIWIDKDHWVVLKMKTMSGDMQSNMEYTTIDFDQKIDDSTFQLDLPEDVVIEDFEDFDDGYSEEEIALTDIPDKMKQSVLYIPDSDKHQLDTISFIEIEGEPSYQDVTIDYKKNELPLMTLTIVALDDEESDEDLDIEDSFEKEKIRNKEGLYMELNEFRSISWSEGDLRYSIEMIDPNITLEMVKEWAEEMEEIN